MAAAYGQTACLDLLLKNGADVNAATNYRWTALMRAVGQGHTACLDLLLKNGADVNAANNDGWTALIVAAYKGHTACLDVLLKNGADVNAANINGETSLTMAAKEGHTDCVELFLNLCPILDVGKLKEALKVAVESKQNESALMIRRHINKLTAQPRPPPEEKPITKATNPYGSSIVSPLSWVSNVTDSFPEATAPMQTLLSKPATDPVLNYLASTRPSKNPPTSKALKRQMPSALVSMEFNYNDLIPIKKLGKGSFGQVYLAMLHETEIAVKVLVDAAEVTAQSSGPHNLRNIPSDDDSIAEAPPEGLLKEAALMASLRHPNIVQFLGFCISPPCIASEVCTRGSLQALLSAANQDSEAAKSITWARRIEMALGAAKGLLHLHTRSPPVLHRDLKSDNLLVAKDWTIKVTDFNLSKLVEDINMSASLASTAGGGGNPLWLAPELFDDTAPSQATDVYAFGIVMWELLTWLPPYGVLLRRDLFGIPSRVIAGERPQLPSSVRNAPLNKDALDAYVALMKRCWAQNADDRPNFKHIVEQLRECAE
jgi:hypothetical protein